MTAASRSALAAACLIALLPAVRAGGPAELATFSGKVVRLADEVAKTGDKLDADAAPYWLALAAEDGKLYPLVKDDGSRLLFKDPFLLNRPVRLTGRLVPGSTLLRVAVVRTVVNGQECEVYYWCDICSIKRGEKNVCECCGGPMQLREEPVKK
jgi:hypothetical protein